MDEMNFQNAAREANNNLVFEVLAEMRERSHLQTLWALESSTLAEFLHSQQGARVTLSCGAGHAFRGTLIGANASLCVVESSIGFYVSNAHIVSAQVHERERTEAPGTPPGDIRGLLSGVVGRETLVFTNSAQEPQRATPVGVGEDYALFSTHLGDPFAQRLSSIVAIGLTLLVSS
jgi:hypothetical protein